MLHYSCILPHICIIFGDVISEWSTILKTKLILFWLWRFFHIVSCATLEEVDNLKNLSLGDFSFLGLVVWGSWPYSPSPSPRLRLQWLFQFWELYEAWHNMIHCRHFPIQLLHNQQQAPLIDLIILLGYLPLSVRWVSDSFRFWRQLHIASTEFASL